MNEEKRDRMMDQPVIALRLPSDLHKRIAAIAEREGNPVTAVVRRLVTERLRDLAVA